MLLLWGCGGRLPPPASPLRVSLAATELVLCEGLTRHVAAGASWQGASRPDAPDLPEITWMSAAPEIVRVDPRSGGITGVRPGRGIVIAHARLAGEQDRTTLRVTVLPGEWDADASREAGRLVCRPPSEPGG